MISINGKYNSTNIKLHKSFALYVLNLEIEKQEECRVK